MNANSHRPLDSKGERGINENDYLATQSTQSTEVETSAVHGVETPTPGTRRYDATKEACAGSRALGRDIDELRRLAGLTQVQLATSAELSRRQVQRITAGQPTRATTVERIVRALVVARPDFDPADDLLARLLSTAGPDGIAPPSAYQERVDRRRARRWRKVRNKHEWAARTPASSRPGPLALVRQAAAAARNDDPDAFEALIDQIGMS